MDTALYYYHNGFTTAQRVRLREARGAGGVTGAEDGVGMDDARSGLRCEYHII